ncbi:MAG: hypothetical protein KJ646_03450 [Nanoarchaeota archaeon]|nr:hypothetical protein [Nanoarchaeota archaeon]MBU4116681.1 hypothetical protein [Nanoarchaeota archaeon]
MALKRYKKKRGRKKKFSKEFKEHLRIGLSAATGFIIAFAWREPLLIALNDFVLKYIKSTAIFQAGVITAFIVTFIGVLFLWLISRALK